MKKFIEHMKANKTPHERRQFAMQAAGLCTALLFVGWLATLGVHLASVNKQVGLENGGNAASTLIAVQAASSTLKNGGY